jgi:hypothetical protein
MAKNGQSIRKLTGGNFRKNVNCYVEEWFVDDVLHRDEGPALIRFSIKQVPDPNPLMFVPTSGVPDIHNSQGEIYEEEYYSNGVMSETIKTEHETSQRDIDKVGIVLTSFRTTTQIRNNLIHADGKFAEYWEEYWIDEEGKEQQYRWIGCYYQNGKPHHTDWHWTVGCEDYDWWNFPRDERSDFFQLHGIELPEDEFKKVVKGVEKKLGRKLGKTEALPIEDQIVLKLKYG